MSVCIVHRDGWAVTDSRERMNNGIEPTTAKKAFTLDGTLVTCVGDAVLGQKLAFLLKNRTMEEIPEAISEWIYDNDQVDGYVLLANKNRQLMTIDGKGYICLIDSVGYWAIGSAADRVLGYLDGQQAMGKVIDTEAAKEAVVRASRFDSGIDARTQVFWLER